VLFRSIGNKYPATFDLQTICDEGAIVTIKDEDIKIIANEKHGLLITNKDKYVIASFNDGSTTLNMKGVNTVITVKDEYGDENINITAEGCITSEKLVLDNALIKKLVLHSDCDPVFAVVDEEVDTARNLLQRKNIQKTIRVDVR